jgi:hypothetical protein
MKVGVVFSFAVVKVCLNLLPFPEIRRTIQSEFRFQQGYSEGFIFSKVLSRRTKSNPVVGVFRTSRRRRPTLRSTVDWPTWGRKDSHPGRVGQPDCVERGS